MSAPAFTCPSCGNDGSDGRPRPFTYVELVPRWQHVELVNGRLVVAFESSYGDEGDQAFLLCERCDRVIDDMPPLAFEGQDESFVGVVCDAPSTSTTEGI
jgi:hypothetical protein